MNAGINKEVLFRENALKERLVALLEESSTNPIMISRRADVLQIIDLVTQSVSAEAEKCRSLLSEAAEIAMSFNDGCPSIDDVVTEGYSFMLSTKVKILD
jgi:hypothetical protein